VKFPTSDNSSFWEIVGSDVVGAFVAGLLKGAAGGVVGGLGGAGVGALDGIIEGATYASAGAGLQQLWDWLF
jgi:hypothetical protein